MARLTLGLLGHRAPPPPRVRPKDVKHALPGRLSAIRNMLNTPAPRAIPTKSRPAQPAIPRRPRDRSVRATPARAHLGRHLCRSGRTRSGLSLPRCATRPPPVDLVVNRVASPANEHALMVRAGFDGRGAARAASAVSWRPPPLTRGGPRSRRPRRRPPGTPTSSSGSSGAKTSGRLEEQRRSVGRRCRRRTDLCPATRPPGHASQLAERGRLGRAASLAAAASGVCPPQLRLGGRERPPRRRAGSAVSAVAAPRRPRRPPSHPVPCARAAERSSSVATVLSPARAPWAKCQARDGRGQPGSVDSAKARVGSRPVLRRTPTGRRPNAPVGDGTITRAPTRAGRPRPRASLPERRPRAAPRRATPGRVTGRFSGGDHEQQAGLDGQSLDAALEALLDPPGERHDGGQPEPARQRRRGQPRGNSNNASGLPCVSATMRSRTRSSSGQRTTESSSARASASASPLTTSSGSPLKSSLGSRRREDHEHRLGDQTAGRERQRLSRRPVQPLGVGPSDAHERVRRSWPLPPAG